MLNTDKPSRALLPAGMADWLPPDAAHEARTVESLMAAFALWGYERVKPPLMEFEDSLFDGPGRALAENTFRLMDPASQRMMGVRADMTVQAARIAAVRMAGRPRPLRLAYAGQVVRVKGGQLRPARQFGQTGAELTGPDTPEADAEVVIMAARAARALGVENISVDLALPTLAPAIAAALGVADAAAEKLRAALERKDSAAVEALRGETGAACADAALALLGAVGPADAAAARLQDLTLAPAPARERARLTAALELIRAAEPELPLTLDPVERRGLEYHTGVTFALFARGVRGELARGGRYETAGGEPAAGVSFYMDTVLQAAPMRGEPVRVFAPAGADRAAVEALRAEGCAVVSGLAPCTDADAEARRLNCAERLDGNARVSVPPAPVSASAPKNGQD
ncbi:MAG: ATP phosphoribosyltransferase regulatory subunit [Rhodospirillales bacterium]